MDTNCNYKGIDFVDFSSLRDEDAKRLFDLIFPNFQYGETELPWRENSIQDSETSSREKFSIINNNNDTTNNNNGPTEQQTPTPMRQRTFSETLAVSTPQTYTSGANLDMVTKAAQAPPVPFLATGSPRTISQFTQQPPPPPITFYSPRPPFPVVTSAYALHGQELIALHPHQQPHTYTEASVYELQPENNPPQSGLDHQHHHKYRNEKQTYPLRKHKKQYYDTLYSHDDVMQTMLDTSVDPLTNQAAMSAPVVPFSNHYPPGMSTGPTGYPMQYIQGYVPYVPYTGYMAPPGALVEMSQASPDVVPYEPSIVIPQVPPAAPATISPVSMQVPIPCVPELELPQQLPEEICAVASVSPHELQAESCEDKQWSNIETSVVVEEGSDLEKEEPLEERVAEIEISDTRDSSFESVQEDAEKISFSDNIDTIKGPSEPEPAPQAEQTTKTSSVASAATTSPAAPAVASAWGSGKTWAGLFKSEGVPVPEPIPVKVQESDAQSGDEDSLPEDVEADCLLHKLGKFIQRLKLDFTTRPFQPRGLINRSNWCYINATLQALLVCPALYNMLRQLQDVVCQRNKSTTPIMDSLVELASEFTPLNNVSKRKEDLSIGPPLEPVCIHKMLSLIKSECIKGRQEDAEEFLSCILNGLHEEMISLTKATTATLNNGTCNGDVQTNGRVDGSEEDDEEDSWKVMGAKNKGMVTRSDQVSGSLVKDLFGGQTRSVLTAGSECSAVLQPFFTLQLDIQTNGESVTESLSQLTVKEPIHGYQCPRSKKEVEACRRTTLEELPPVLILHFKRFVYDDKDGGSKKVLKRTDYPLDLELKTELLSPEVKKKYIAKQSRSYKLFAVVYHDGKEAVKGHYIADIFYPGSRSWLRCDDRNIVPTTEAQVLAFNSPCVPYLLFYSRTDLHQDLHQPATK